MNTHKTLKILIAEDECIIANDIQRTLQRLGYSVCDIVSSGNDLFQSVTKTRPDLVLMDIKLKGEMDGIEVAHRLQSELKIPVVYLTAHADDATLKRAKCSEPHGYIVKPFVESSLHSTIEMAINKNQMEIKRAKIIAKKEKICSKIAQSEKSLKKKVEALLRSNEELEQFAATASHDLKSPLCNILAYSEELEKEFSLLEEEEGKSYLQVIRNSAAHMNELINNLLEFARISHTPKVFKEIDLKDLIFKICKNLEVKINEKKATIEIGELPRLKANPLQLQHVFQNLIENAIKFCCTDQAQTPMIKIDGKVVDDFAEIHVRDNGIGFDEKDAETIFLPFRRLDDTREGTGIGLAICRKIIENYGGQIIAKSEINKGSDFIIKLPMS